MENQNEEETLKQQEETAQTTNENAESATSEKPQEDKAAEQADTSHAEEELETARKTIEEMKDKYLRLSAEFDNYRKRTMKEKAELIRNGAEKTIGAILPILDDLERALQNIQKSDDKEAVYQGVDLIMQKFQKILAQEGLEKMEPVGKDFDTDFHEAIALVPAEDEKQKGKVLDCIQTGYKLNDKVIRHAKVVVAQ